MLKSVQVPAAFEPPFARAEQFVEKLFGDFQHAPEKGSLHIGGDRYVLMRAESLYLAWFDAMESAFGVEASREFIYNTAREIGRSDSKVFAERLGLTNGVDRLSSGPVHFAHAGWARVQILEDSVPAEDERYRLHYFHPNTFESEVIRAKGRKPDTCACFFSAGYSAGWCSEAFRVDVHGREVRCVARGDANCEFVMAPSSTLDAIAAEVLGKGSGS